VRRPRSGIIPARGGVFVRVVEVRNSRAPGPKACEVRVGQARTRTRGRTTCSCALPTRVPPARRRAGGRVGGAERLGSGGEPGTPRPSPASASSTSPSSVSGTRRMSTPRAGQGEGPRRTVRWQDPPSGPPSRWRDVDGAPTIRVAGLVSAQQRAPRGHAPRARDRVIEKRSPAPWQERLSRPIRGSARPRRRTRPPHPTDHGRRLNDQLTRNSHRRAVGPVPASAE